MCENIHASNRRVTVAIDIEGISVNLVLINSHNLLLMPALISRG